MAESLPTTSQISVIEKKEVDDNPELIIWYFAAWSIPIHHLKPNLTKRIDVQMRHYA